MEAHDKRIQNDCDVRYVMKVWLMRCALFSVLGVMGVVFAAGLWKSEVDLSIRSLGERMVNMELKVDRMYSNIDTIKVILRERY